MAKEKTPDPPADDIPAWFMTYSDVITLLMTFFILLLTFSTTEPEKFDKVEVSAFGKSGASGVVGHPHDGMDQQSWIQRVRPRAARIAINGTEMPPMLDQQSSEAVGRGLDSVSEAESQQDVMSRNSFQVPLRPLVNEHASLTPRGVEIANIVAGQLRKLPVHCAIELSDQLLADRATSFLSHLYDVEKVRPGQVGLGFADDVDSNSIRFVFERYEN